MLTNERKREIKFLITKPITLLYIFQGGEALTVRFGYFTKSFIGFYKKNKILVPRAGIEPAPRDYCTKSSQGSTVPNATATPTGQILSLYSNFLISSLTFFFLKIFIFVSFSFLTLRHFLLVFFFCICCFTKICGSGLNSCISCKRSLDVKPMLELWFNESRRWKENIQVQRLCGFIIVI